MCPQGLEHIWPTSNCLELLSRLTYKLINMAKAGFGKGQVAQEG